MNPNSTCGGWVDGFGTGGYGTVYRVKRKGDGQLFAIKCNLPPSVLPSLSPSCTCFVHMKEAAAAAAAHIQTNRKCFFIKFNMQYCIPFFSF